MRTLVDLIYDAIPEHIWQGDQDTRGARRMLLAEAIADRIPDLSRAWYEAQAACPPGWRVIGISADGETQAMATAYGPKLVFPPCRTCGVAKQPPPEVLVARGADVNGALDNLAEKLRALA